MFNAAIAGAKCMLAVDVETSHLTNHISSGKKPNAKLYEMLTCQCHLVVAI